MTGAEVRALNVFFDVDGTLLTYDDRLRPHVHAVFQRLQADGHRIYIWSGTGLRHAVVEENGLADYVSGVFPKPLADFQEQLRAYTPIDPDFVVDDHPQIVEALGGFQIEPALTYTVDDPNDREMWRAYDAIRAHAERPPAGR